MTHGADTSFLVAVEIVEHARHVDALSLLRDLLARGDRMAIAPQVLAEFVHIVTDARHAGGTRRKQNKCYQPMWRWRVSTTGCGVINSAGNAFSMRCSPATYRAAGVNSLLTLNTEDFAVFGEFVCVPLTSTP